jgi:hypothetical protein
MTYPTTKNWPEGDFIYSWKIWAEDDKHSGDFYTLEGIKQMKAIFDKEGEVYELQIATSWDKHSVEIETFRI